MSDGILFVSSGSDKAIFLTSGDILIKFLCSRSNTCSSQDSCRSCDLINTAKSYMGGKGSSSNVKLLDGELAAGIGEYKIGKNVLLKGMGLGSCIGVILSDVSTGICGIAHVLLPGASDKGETKYAETAIEKMFDDMVKMGARKSRITAKFAGGAQVFKHMNLDILKIGDRNAASVEEALTKKNIPILAKDVGGEVGRNVIFNPVDGSMIVKYTTKGDVMWF